MGESHPRPTAMLKACGLAKFGGDIFIEGAVEIACAHSTEYHARIKAVDTSEAGRMPGVIGVMTAKDVPGTNRLRMMAATSPSSATTRSGCTEIQSPSLPLRQESKRGQRRRR